MDIVERLRKESYWALSKEAADEIERLQEDHHDVRILNEQYFNEIELLREALQKIVDKNPFKHNVTPTKDLNYYPMLIAEIVAIVSAAL